MKILLLLMTFTPAAYASDMIEIDGIEFDLNKDIDEIELEYGDLIEECVSGGDCDADIRDYVDEVGYEIEEPEDDDC